jgi:membrane protein
MAGLGDRVRSRVDVVRRRRPLVDHLVRMQEHYGQVKAGQQAGAVTYFAFLSFFPILALAFFVVGWISRVYSDARHQLTQVLNSVMPGLIGHKPGQLKLDQIEQAASTLGIVGAIVLLYSGLGWLSAMRDALITVLETPPKQQPGFVSGKLRDLVTLVLIGVVTLVTVVLGFAANMLLFFMMFTLLAEPRAPRSALWQGAAVGATAFEVLKQLSGLLLRIIQGNPATQAFGIALIVLVWINYFSRVVLYAAAFAHTAPSARALRESEPAAPVQGPPSPPVRAEAQGEERPGWVAPYAAGAVSTLGLMAVVRKLSRRSS